MDIKKQLIIKGMFDLIFSILLLPIILFPLVLLIILSSLSTRRFGLFYQKRIGQYGNKFTLYKIRSLRGTRHLDALDIKKNETIFGTWLRKSKLDELPQIFNVINGTMSLVGPRPDVPGYADLLEGDDRIILNVKPGITGPATIKYKNEDNLLLKQENPQEYNDEVIWPDKVKINKEYVRNWSLWKDVGYLWASVFDSMQ
jgi:lipopolysaccharide/colanic/teichoic acid biosynthesis glycosyltransferase